MTIKLTTMKHLSIVALNKYLKNEWKCELVFHVWHHKQKNMKINSLKLKCFENIFSESFPKLIKSSRKIKHFVSKIFHGSRGGILQYYDALLIFFWYLPVSKCKWKVLPASLRYIFKHYISLADVINKS